jgi:hypothetical protein
MKPETVDYTKLSRAKLIEQLLKRDIADIARKQEQIYHCECGVQTIKSHKARHFKTKGHQEFATKQQLKNEVDAIIRKQQANK